MTRSTEELNLLVHNSQIDESINDILSPKIENLKVEDVKTIQLKNEITYLTKNVNESEQYLSKDCILFRKLPLLSGRSIIEDVVTFIN